MAALILLVIILIGLALYLTTGWQLAVRNLPRAWKIARKKYIFRDYIRFSVKSQTAAMFLLWPLYLPYRFTLRTFSKINSQFNRAVETYDPKRPAQLIATRDRTDLREIDEGIFSTKKAKANRL